MFDRLWWFIAGLVAGGVVMTRALRRKPTSDDLRLAATQTGADALELLARAVRPKSRPRQR